jgi:hypothetical protein
LLPAGTPGRLVELIQRCLRKDVRERQRDAGDVRLELDAIARGGPAGGAETTPAVTRRRPAWPALAATALLAALATFALTRAFGHAPAPRTLLVTVQAPEGEALTDEVPDISISPDGSTLAFVATDTSGTDHLWLRPLASNQARELPGTQGAKLPFWSPDGRQIGFFADGNLKRISLTGEGLQTICPAPNPRGAAWGPRDLVVFAPTASGPLQYVPAGGGPTRAATILDSTRGETAHRFPSFLPDGKRFLYVALPGKDNDLDTRLGTVGGPPGPVVLTARSKAEFAAPGCLVFTRQGVILAQRCDPRTLRVRGEPTPVPGLRDVAGSYSGSPIVSVSGDGTLVQQPRNPDDMRVEVWDRQGRRLQTLALPQATYS